MCQLIGDQTSPPVRAEVRRDLDRSAPEIIRHLCMGRPVLVPYDADSNYEPCLKSGARAHWATICGFCVAVSSDQVLEVGCKTAPLGDPPDRHQIVHLDHHQAARLFEQIKSHLSDLGRIFVYARQGKTRRVQLWNFQQLVRSNRNLRQVSGRIMADPNRGPVMVLPGGGDLTHSLSNQFILVDDHNAK